VRAAETAQAGGGGELPFTRAVMRSLFKLMSYKDEYEVARLYTSGDFRRALEQQFEGEFTLKFHLAPPLFSEKDPVTGHLRKREYGPWMMRAFGLLARLRVLRGTRLDPFGYLAERRMERRLIADYESLLERLLPKLDGANSALISEIAALPLAIRGFGHVKERNLERALARQEELLMKLEAPASVVRIRAA
jgi:indolepyruvate ferredoxin oxidoreductase